MPTRFKFNVLTNRLDLVVVADDTAFGAAWDGSEEAPTQNATYDEIITLVAAAHARQHTITAIADHISGATPARMLKADANGLPVDATNTDAQVSAAVTASHAKQHAITSALDHTSTATAGQMLQADANGLPVDATNTDLAVAVAVAAAHARSHAITGTLDHTSTATAGKMLKADANGLPVDATNTDAQVSAAVTASHARSHSIIGTSDHTSAATAGKMLKADANGLPIDATNTDADVADAVSKKHTQGTDTTLGAMTTDINMNTHQLTTLSVPDAAGEAIRQTAKITEVNLESAVDLKHTQNTDKVIKDADADTMVQVEEAADEDKVRIDCGSDGEKALFSKVGTESYVQVNSHKDEDGDTQIQVEESADEDKIRFDTGGTERMIMDSSGLDFKTLKAIAMACDNGATLPAAPVAGQWFLHTPTDRKILMQYDGSSWIPLVSIGSMTMYVDVTGATHGDNQNYGYSNAVTFDTIQFAVNQIPGLVGGNVIIYVDNAIAAGSAGNTYSGTVTIQGKNFTGAYSISIYGHLQLLESLTCDGNALLGDFRVQGTVTRNSGIWTAEQRQHKLVKFTSGLNNGLYRIVDHHLWIVGYDTLAHAPEAGEVIKESGATADAWGVVSYVDAANLRYFVVPIVGTWTDEENVDVYNWEGTLHSAAGFKVESSNGNSQSTNRLAIVGTWSAGGAPANGDTYNVYDWGTTISGLITIVSGQIGVYFYDLKTTSNRTSQQSYTQMYMYRCWLTHTANVISSQGKTLFYQCYVYGTGATYLTMGAGASFEATQVKFLNNNTAGLGQNIAQGASASYNGCIFEGSSDRSNNALFLQIGGTANLFTWLSAEGAKQFRNFDVAVLAGTAGYANTVVAVVNGFINVGRQFEIPVGGSQYSLLQLQDIDYVPTSGAAFGSLYIDNGTPDDLWWIDDAGNVEQLSAASAAFLFIWDRSSHRIVGVQTYADWNSIPKENGGFITVFKRQWDLTKYEYKLYPPQSYSPPYQTVIVGYSETGEPITQEQVIWSSITIDSLGLQDFTAEELPHSMHVAALKSVDVATKKATVVRKFMRVNYEVPNCYISLEALKAYQSGEVKLFNPAYAIDAPENADSFVLIYFISETPYDTAIEIPVIIDKAVKSDSTVNPPATGGMGYTLNVQALTSSPVDGQTVYFGQLPKAPVTVAGTSKVYIRKAGTIKIAEIYCYSGTAGTAESWSLYIRKNNTTDTLIKTLAVSANERIFSNAGLSIPVVAGDYVEIKGVQPTWPTNPLTTVYSGYIYIE